jgi:hypothetical protein
MASLLRVAGAGRFHGAGRGLDTPRGDWAFADEHRGLVALTVDMRKIESPLDEDWLLGTPEGGSREEDPRLAPSV